MNKPAILISSLTIDQTVSILASVGNLKPKTFRLISGWRNLANYLVALPGINPILIIVENPVSNFKKEVSFIKEHKILHNQMVIASQFLKPHTF